MASPSNVDPDEVFVVPCTSAKRGSKNPGRVLLRIGDTVRSNPLLRSLEAHGHIKRPEPMFMPVPNYWGSRGVSYVYCEEGKPHRFVYASFFKFRIEYRDGAFFPYVVFEGLTGEGLRLNAKID